MKNKTGGRHSSHSCLKSRTAIKEAGAEARKRYELYTHAAFVLVFTYWDVSKLEQFSSSFGKNGHDRLFVGTSDPKFTHRGTERGNFTEIGSFDPLHTIVVPYRSNYELDADLSQQTVQGRSGNKSVTFFFAGAFDRRFEGELRGPTMRAMQHGDGVHGGGNNNDGPIVSYITYDGSVILNNPLTSPLNIPSSPDDSVRVVLLRYE